MLMTVLLVILILALLGALHDVSGHDYGWGPPGGLGLVVLIFLILILTGHL